jgi:hypothetical protein
LAHARNKHREEKEKKNPEKKRSKLGSKDPKRIRLPDYDILEERSRRMSISFFNLAASLEHLQRVALNLVS